MSLNETDGVVVSAEKYREDGLLKRVVRMMKGLSRPRDSREYKEALIELQRLVAPLAAILLPALAVVVLIVVSAVNSNKPKEQKLDIWMADSRTTPRSSPTSRSSRNSRQTSRRSATRPRWRGPWNSTVWTRPG